MKQRTESFLSDVTVRLVEESAQSGQPEVAALKSASAAADPTACPVNGVFGWRLSGGKWTSWCVPLMETVKVY